MELEHDTSGAAQTRACSAQLRTDVRHSTTLGQVGGGQQRAITCPPPPHTQPAPSTSSSPRSEVEAARSTASDSSSSCRLRSRWCRWCRDASCARRSRAVVAREHAGQTGGGRHRRRAASGIAACPSGPSITTTLLSALPPGTPPVSTLPPGCTLPLRLPGCMLSVGQQSDWPGLLLNSISPRSFGARIVRSTAAAAAQLQLLWPDAVRTAVRRSTRRISRQQQT